MENSTGPSILPVKDPPKEKPRKIVHPNLPELPTIMVLVMPTKSGKSTILSNLLLREDFYKGVFDNVTIMSNTIQQDKTSRFLRKACDCYTGYDDNVLAGIIEQQKSFDDDERPFVGMIFDDILGSVKRSSYLNHLVTRSRHYGVGLLAISVQSFKAVGPTIRNNCNSFICGNLQNMSELDKISQEYSGMFGGDLKFRQIYAEATKDRYDFMYLDLQSNPSRAFRSFSDLLAVGDKLMFGEGVSLDMPDEKTEVETMPSEDLPTKK
tara:strand:+ start:1316 stop:2113 length:798 start_codon:yes stop_codon:yes gene_type:complete